MWCTSQWFDAEHCLDTESKKFRICGTDPKHSQGPMRQLLDSVLIDVLSCNISCLLRRGLVELFCLGCGIFSRKASKS